MIAALSAEALETLTAFIDERVSKKLLDVAAPTAPELMTVQEAAEYLRTTPGAVYKRIKRKQIPAYRPEGSGWLLRRGDLDRLLDRTTDWSYDQNRSRTWPREAGTSGAVTPGG